MEKCQPSRGLHKNRAHRSVDKQEHGGFGLPGSGYAAKGHFNGDVPQGS
jgi:hypothetical protein